MAGGFLKLASGWLAVVTALLTGVLMAHSQPRCAGIWTLVPDANATGGGTAAQAMPITQDANTITITRATQMGEFTATYKLDGTQSKNTINFQGNSMDQLSTAKWDAGKLKIDT